MKIIVRYIFILLAFQLAGCASAPFSHKKPPSIALTDTGSTVLGQAVQRYSKGKIESGFQPLFDGLDAFSARMVLAQTAEQSLDVQYYIWHNDEVGKLLISALIAAADRGVRVRILLDDFNLGDNDEALHALNSHPNVELRLFNPFQNRLTRLPEMLFSFERINRRMHNKSFTADNQVTIVGGRNIGNEYYSAKKDVNFVDMDVVAIGPVVQQVSISFDEYWNNDLSVPVSDLIDPVARDKVEQLRDKHAQYINQLPDSEYVNALKQSSFIQNLKEHKLVFYWGEAHVISDEPEKITLSSDDQSTHLVSKLIPLINDVKEEFMIVSPYFIPGNKGIDAFKTLLNRGVSITALTNSLASTDVGMVYAGYSKYRIPMLQAGVELFELKPEINKSQNKKTDKKSTFGSSSRASLHSKIYMFDRKKIFFGSFNLDPRSSRLNTELGILFINQAFGALMRQHWDNNIHDRAYQLTFEEVDDYILDDTIKQLVWIEKTDQGDSRHYQEPLTGFWRRLTTGLLGLLPLEDQL